MGFSEEVMICRTPAASSTNHGLVALTACQHHSWNRREHPLPHLGKASHSSVPICSSALEWFYRRFHRNCATYACSTCTGQRELP
jgi:hypothetical protein